MFLDRIATIFSLCLLCSCGSTPDPEERTDGTSTEATKPALFVELSADSTGMRYMNSIPENNEQNYFVYEYFYNGGGVGIGDVNNDGLPDVYLTGNLVKDELYLNKGNMRFERVTEQALPKETKHGWHSGVAMADVNGDGWLDMYVCRAGWSKDPTERTNLLYINQQNGTFSEEAEKWGVADTTRSTQAVFFDKDRDGDLDLYVLNTPLQNEVKLNNLQVEALIRNRTSPSDRLYRNDGGKFTDVTASAGVWNMAYGLGVAVSDLNGDGRPDIYVANDYIERDYMYIQQSDGTYKDELIDRTRHISNFAMGCEVADHNNDGLVDIMVVDMVSEDHVRSKMNMGGMSTKKFWEVVQFGYHYQYMFNTLQLNNGNGTFSDIGQLAGVSKTDWSWAPLLADLDNDGWKDLLITNGYKRDARDNDYNITAKKLTEQKTPVTYEDVLKLIPANKVRNYLYQNNGDLSFSDRSEEWGFTKPINSNGAAYADLDGDGDLDLVVNNIDAFVSVWENQSRQQGSKHFVQVVLEGANTAVGLGGQVWVKAGGTEQFQEVATTRGFQSSVSSTLHFGLGDQAMVEEIRVKWPDGKWSVMNNVQADRVVDVKRSGAVAMDPTEKVSPLLAEDRSGAPAFKHVENTYDDFEKQVLIPHKRSEDGPFLAVADVNGDDRDDLFVGGARGQSGELFLLQANGAFTRSGSRPWEAHKDREDQGALFVDVDGDTDLDLIVMNGSNETDQFEDQFQPRLYLNDGNGKFSTAASAFPFLMTSAMRASASDVDGDGDQDLFIGGRIIPGQYPRSPRSYLLLNDGKGHFSDHTEELAPDLATIGMVTDAVFLDIDKDGDQDLFTLGEWMPLAMYRNDGGRFMKAEVTGFEDSEGWWERMVPADLDGDGDMDLVCGNLGWNSKFHGTADHPLHVYWNDFDGNGQYDIVLAKTQNDVLYPVRGRQCSSEQCPNILQKFGTYEAFAKASVEQIYTPEKIASAEHFMAKQMRSCVAWNNGDGTFTLRPLPNLAQTAPLKGIAVHDMNGDGILDIVCAGNHWGAEVETIRYDGGVGRILLGDGAGGFRAMSVVESGFFAWNNVRDLALVRNGKNAPPGVVVANNNDKLQLFRPTPRSNMVSQR